MIVDITKLSQFEEIIKTKNENYLFDEKTDKNLNHILLNCSDESLCEYKNLLKVESLTHAPEIQYELAEILRSMALELHRIEYPCSPICQWFMEIYYSPALYWAIQAVKQNYLPAYNTERIIVEQGGKDVKSDFELAKALLFEAAIKGNVDAQLKLAREYTKKENKVFNAAINYVEYNPEEAEKWYCEVEKQQDPDSFEDLAIYYSSIKKYEKSNEYFNKLIKMDTKNHKYYIDVILNYLHMGNSRAAAIDVLGLIRNENDDILIQAYKRLHPQGWMQIDDIMIEKYLLDTLVSQGNLKAKRWLKEKYKNTIFGRKFKRTRHWNDSIFFD